MMRNYLIRAFVCAALLSVGRPANAQTIAPEFQADIERLMDVVGASSLGEQLANLASSSVLQGLKQRGDVPERVFVIVQEVLSAEFAKAFSGPDGMRPKQVA